MSDGLRVNFSSKEATSEAREPMPAGKYHVKITDIDPRESQSEKNFGKPYWAIEFTVQEGPYSDRKAWTNCMLFDGALYTLSQLMKSTGYDVDEGDFEVPDSDELIGRDVVVRLIKKAATDEYDARNEVKGISAWDDQAASGTSAGKSNSLLP
jgi:hypothetical protein